MVKLFDVFSVNILKYIRFYAIVKIEIGLVERPRSYLIGGETPRHLFYITEIGEKRIENS